MNNKRKNRGGPLRTQRTRSVNNEGVYGNVNFMHATTRQIGTICRIKTAAGIVWEGIFRTFSSGLDIVLDSATKVDNPDGEVPNLLIDTLVDNIIIKAADIVTMDLKDVDLDYPTRDTFQTDTAISARLNGSAKLAEKELEPWEPSSGVNGGVDAGLPLELENANGWDANDMFRKNEQEYGVTSTFDHSLKGYTVPLKSVDSADYREAEAKAAQIANEIESQPQYKMRLELENGDEEAIYAAVQRPSTNQDSTDKYIPPAKRKTQNAGKLMRSTPPPPVQGNAQSMASGKNAAGATAVVASPSQPMNYAPHPMHGANVGAPPPHMPPPQMSMPQQPPQHPVPNHNNHNRAAHSHTPPHGGGYNNQTMQRQGPPPPVNQQKPQMNGEPSKPMQQRLPRGVYQGGNNPPNLPPPQPPFQNEQQVKQAPPPPVQDPTMNHPRHPMNDETIKEMHRFSQDFKLVPSQAPSTEQQPPPPQMVLHGQVPMEQMAPPQVVPPPLNKQPSAQQQHQQVTPPQQATPPQQPQQSVSPPDNPVDKLTSSLKKSTLNPDAKEFIYDPTRKFTPRSPSNPSASRPHTPQTPSHNPYMPASASGPAGQPHMPVMVGYMMTSQPPYQPQPQGNRMRKSLPMSQMRTDVTSQMQVAAATGQPLLAPAPMPQFVYPPGMTPQGYPQVHLRMYEGPPQMPYLPPNHSNAPSPAQPPQYAPGQGPQPPPQQYQTGPPPQGPHQFPMLCPIIHTQPHMMQSMQYLQQPPPPQHHLPVLMSQQHPQAQQHGPAP